MGVKFIDIHLTGHFFYGFISFILFKSIGTPLLLNFIITNGLHLFIECIEKNTTPSGLVIESLSNHISDVIFFLMGWILSSIIDKKPSESTLKVLWILLIYGFSKEIIREIYPYNNFILFRGAFYNK